MMPEKTDKYILFSAVKIVFNSKSLARITRMSGLSNAVAVTNSNRFFECLGASNAKTTSYA